jgi:hypothetical protein
LVSETIVDSAGTVTAGASGVNALIAGSATDSAVAGTAAASWDGADMTGVSAATENETNRNNRLTIVDVVRFIPFTFCLNKLAPASAGNTK